MENKLFNPSTARGLVSKSLWRRNYRVKNVSHVGSEFDLLVQKGTRVKVVTSTERIELYPERFDVLCFVSFDARINMASIFYLKNKTLLRRMRIEKTSLYTVEGDDLQVHFTRKPQEVFT